MPLLQLHFQFVNSIVCRLYRVINTYYTVLVIQFRLHIRHFLEMFGSQLQLLFVDLALVYLLIQALNRIRQDFQLVWKVVHMNDLLLQKHGLLLILIYKSHIMIDLPRHEIVVVVSCHDLPLLL